ncbi:MAG TPA: glucosaminidase domain-containing protein, partial [Bacillales bacterium]|nr:glucosaminidase domain-containing protein [Bacillales bacterium]
TFYNASGNKVGTAYEYFDILPLHTKTSYDAADLNRYVKQNIPSDYKQAMGGDGPLARLGKYFIQAQNKYGVNALYLFAHAIHESAWGSSKIAQEKHNLFGLHATDTDTYDNATGFKSYQACINYAAKYVANKYQDPEGAYYYGAMLGNKQSGMNVKYASDPFWGQKIAGYMYRIDKALGGKDFGKYTLGVAAASSLNVHSTPHTGATIYQYKNPGAGIIITGTRKNGEGTWYQIYSDEHDFRNSDKVYVYHNGQYDLLSKKVNIAGK